MPAIDSFPEPVGLSKHAGLLLVVIPIQGPASFAQFESHARSATAQ
jgi:hypothetical protein